MLVANAPGRAAEDCMAAGLGLWKTVYSQKRLQIRTLIDLNASPLERNGEILADLKTLTISLGFDFKKLIEEISE